MKKRSILMVTIVWAHLSLLYAFGWAVQLEAVYPTLGKVGSPWSGELWGSFSEGEPPVWLHYTGVLSRSLSTGARINAIARYEERAILALQSQHVVDVNLSDPLNPAEFKRIEMTGAVKDVCVNEHYLVAALSDPFDRSGRVDSIHIGTFGTSEIQPFSLADTNFGQFQHFCLHGGLLAIAGGPDGVSLFRLESTGTQISVEAIPLPAIADARDVLLLGDLLFVAAGDQGVVVVKLNLLRHDLPNIIHTYSAGRTVSANRLLTCGSGLVAVFDEYLLYFDIAGIDHEFIRDGEFLPVGEAFHFASLVDQIDIANSGERLYALNRSPQSISQNLIQVIDYQQPEYPQIVETYPVGQATRLQASDRMILLASPDDELATLFYGASQQTSAFRERELTCPTRDIIMAGDIVALANGDCGLTLIPDQGRQATRKIDTAGTANGLAYNGASIWLAAGSAGLQRIDLADREVRVDTYRPDIPRGTGVDCRLIDIKDNIAYVVNQSDQPGAAAHLLVFDLTSPRTPWVPLQDPVEISAGGYTLYEITDIVVGSRVVALADRSGRIRLVPIDAASGLLTADRQYTHEAIYPVSLAEIEHFDLVNDVLYAVYQTPDIDNGGILILEGLDIGPDGYPTFQEEYYHPLSGEIPLDIAVDEQESVAVISFRANWLSGIAAFDLALPEGVRRVGEVLTKEADRHLTLSDHYCHLGGSRMVRHIPGFQKMRAEPEAGHMESILIETQDDVLDAGRYTISSSDAAAQPSTLTAALLFSEDADLFTTKAVIIAGGSSDTEHLGPEFRSLGKQAYSVLNDNGFTADNIRYLSDDLSDEHVFRAPDEDSARYALERWIETDTTQVILYLVGHGDQERFQLHESDDEVLDAQELDQWLDALQTDKNVEIVVVIYDGCFSGSFINTLQPPEGRRRLLITSTALDERADISESGGHSFSRFFWTEIGSADSGLGSAFLHARDQMSKWQNAQIHFYGQITSSADEPSVAADRLNILSGGNHYYIEPSIDYLKAVLTSGATPQLQVDASVLQADRVWVDVMTPDQRPGGEIVGDGRGFDLAPVSGVSNFYRTNLPLANGVGTYQVIAKASRDNTFFVYTSGQTEHTPIHANIRQALITLGEGQVLSVRDDFEPDDALPFVTAPILNDMSPPRHTFHSQDDQDRFWLYGLTDQRYEIETVSVSEACRPRIAICGAGGEALSDMTAAAAGFGERAKITWDCPEDGLYQILVTNVGNTFGGTVNYALYIGKPEAPLAVLVSGVILDPDGLPLSGARIRTDDEMTAVSREAGRFDMFHRPGTYNLTCEADDYQPQTMGITFSEGGENYVEVRLGSPVEPPVKPHTSGGGSGGCFMDLLIRD